MQQKVIGISRHTKIWANPYFAVRHRWVEFFEELLNLEDGVQASIVEVVRDRMMPVFDRLNTRGVENYEVE